MNKKFPEKVFDWVKFPTGWISTDAVHYYTCPRCQAAPGYYCITPSGRKMGGLSAHSERMDIELDLIATGNSRAVIGK